MPRPCVLKLATIATVLTGLITFNACSADPELDADQRRAHDVSYIFLNAIVEEDASGACAVTAIDGVPVHDEPEWEKACVEGIEESNTSPERRDAYERQLDAGATVDEVNDDTATLTWDEDGSAGVDPTVHTLQKIDEDWYVTQ